MYRDWYVAYANQMAAEDVASFLSLLDVLKNPDADVDLRRLSLEEAERHLEYNLQVYILPYLAEIAIDESELQNDAKKLIHQIAIHSNKKLAKEVSREIGDSNIVREQMKRHGEMDEVPCFITEEGYIALAESINSIICLSALINL